MFSKKPNQDQTAQDMQNQSEDVEQKLQQGRSTLSSMFSKMAELEKLLGNATPTSPGTKADASSSATNGKKASH